MYASSMGETMYDGGIGMEPNMDTLDDVMMGQNSQPNGTASQDTLVNPIDKLYSMQSSYFNTD